MTTKEVAERLVNLCRKGSYQEAIQELYAPEIISVEAEGVPDRSVQGLAAIAEKGVKFQSMLERVNTSSVSDPLVAGNHFSVAMLMNVKLKGHSEAIDMDEICIYTVDNGKIVREEFFYTPNAVPA